MNHFPYAQCMVYLPTFGCFLGQMLVNIPYMENMGLVFTNGGFLKWDGVPKLIIQNETILVLKSLLLAIPYFKKPLAPKNHKSCVISVRLPRSFQQR